MGPPWQVQFQLSFSLLFAFSFSQDLDVWQEASCVDCNIDIRLAPDEYNDVTSVLKENGFLSETVVDDVQSLVDNQKRDANNIHSSIYFDYSRYHPLEEVNSI